MKIIALISILFLQGCISYKIKNSRNNYAYIYFDMTTHPKNLSLDYYFDDLMSKKKLEESYAHLIRHDTSIYIIRLLKGKKINLSRIYKYAHFYDDTTKASLNSLIVSFRKNNEQHDTIFIGLKQKVVKSTFKKTFPFINSYCFSIKE